MAALAIAELSTTEAIATCVSCLLCRGLFRAKPQCLNAINGFASIVPEKAVETQALCTAASPERGCGGAGNCWIKHDQGYCRVRELLALSRLIFAWPYGACAGSWCVGAATLLCGAYDVCAAAAGFAVRSSQV